MRRACLAPAGIVAPVALALMALAGSPARGDDAGTRSIFASGAGNRALGMGSAFVAVADDASATVWNPGGLGFAPRLQISAAYTNYYDLGLSETFVGATAPSWRWGAAGMSLRHFGADGIERRDDRNVLLPGDVTDSETELALAYGHSMGEAFGLGGALKLQRQSLAGLSGGGIGADLGVMVQPGALFEHRIGWADDLSFGLAARNLWAPSVRLDLESVPDPTTVRTGLAYRLPFADGRAVLATMDLEKSAAMTARFHAGLEVQIRSLFALRGGLDHGNLTAGADFLYHDLAIQYVFQEQPLGALQRIGISHAFGLTVPQSRVVAREKEEHALQTRLDDAYQKRQAAQADELVAQAGTMIDQGRYDEALEALATVGMLAPAHPGIVPAQVRGLNAKGRQLESAGDLSGATIAYERALMAAPEDSVAAASRARCRSESDRLARRSEDLRRRYSEAFEAFVHGDFAKARQGFAGVLAIEPGDAEAKAMLKRTDEALVAQAIAPRPATAPAPAIAPPVPAHAAAPAPIALSREQQREVEQLYRRGEEAMSAHRPDDAVRYWEFVWSMAPGYGHVADYLKREYLVRGMELFSAGRLDDAAELWQKALKVDPNDARAKAYLARARDLRERSRALANGER